MTYATAGTLESNDCMITVTKQDQQEIIIDSIVKEAFGDQILAVILDVLNQLKVKNIKVHIQDKGALDYTITARLKTALKRLEDVK
ncbi:MAG: citrate lyase acyl carrier protein [Tenericutes bacterium GWC2_34_14]|nr:MAG: citrate lyase acyl carrier protein [Tenericutes bacterium GWA2_35_7]OHE28241.1 MAG: citrate lyase acyl carrier protein [Tenericutes bacterium GWC2_34_14]OHE33133.1 MAG: citrate lyase acyl carrier protein [Tenericutes bacterium GWE2_34_108]OHE36253.1 MAG: citrate lyase acyl carrier protein [Tenericutes bacterium GWF1_35_14]OHE38705.1 MAG: citrate lyase acyl carrier protein [Tenericutes bacterium GWF2_35_184]OHE44795.1 MAG: citrate lyase acyl carrier protein [Tenericutes bacterium RIFOXY